MKVKAILKKKTEKGMEKILVINEFKDLEKIDDYLKV